MKLNKIYNMDCIKGMNQISDNSIDLIVTDPPYLIKYKTNRRKDKEHDSCREILNDDNEPLIKDYIKECYRILKDDKAMYMFCNCDKVEFFKTELQKYFTIKNMIIWVKNNHTAGDLKAQLGKQYEIIFLVNKGRCHFNGKRITDVWHFDRVSGKEQIHQNQKPVELIQQCIEKHSNENDIVFDGFSGSATFAIACLELNRKYLGFELSEHEYDKGKKRINDYINDFLSRYIKCS